MYLTVLKAAVVEALRATFDAEHPQPDFRGINIGIEYPVEQSSYPGLWVNYDDTDELTVAGINHTEVAVINGVDRPVTRWRFAGTITITVVALSSLERDRLYDELVKVMAFARVNPSISEFRDLIELNDLIAMNGNFDKLRPSGDNAAPGTPWGTDEFIYEKSLSMDLIGEFVSDPDALTLVSLSAIRVLAYPEGTPEPPFTGQPPEILDPGLPGSVPTVLEINHPRGWQ